MLARHNFNLVPATHMMEIFEFQDSDPTYQHTRPDGAVVPMGISVAKLQQRLGGDEGDYRGPSGETYHISLARWKGKDPEKTLLHMTFRTTPLFPVDIAPELRPSPLSRPPTIPQRGTPSTGSPTGTAALPAFPMPQSDPISRVSRSADFISCSDVRGDHRIKIQQSRNPDVGVVAKDLLLLPEMTMAEIQCPVCDASIKFSEPFTERLHQGIEWWGEEAKIQLIFDHPADVEEIRPEPANPPFVVHRYQRYTPISLPTRSKDPDVEISIVQKVHDHLVIVTSDAGETTAHTLLALPEVHQTELSCPLCDELLPVKEPTENYIRIFVADAGDDTIHIRWIISHPSDRAETKIPSQEDAIYATHHAADNKFVQKRYEDDAGFVARKKGSSDILKEIM